jgi:YgiT-type zinc finger domain-containing protein
VEAWLQKQKIMKCFVCNQAETTPGKTSVILERDHLTLTVTNVPARICPQCGEAYADDNVTLSLLRQAEEMVKAGAKVAVREFVLT